jgi:hypothetical protein
MPADAETYAREEQHKSVSLTMVKERILRFATKQPRTKRVSA